MKHFRSPLRNIQGNRQSSPNPSDRERCEHATTPLWYARNLYAAAVAVWLDNCRESHPHGTWESDDRDRRSNDALDAMINRRQGWIEAIGRSAGFNFKFPDERTIEMRGVVASVREGDRLFMLVVESDDIEREYRIEEQFRPLVVDLDKGASR